MFNIFSNSITFKACKIWTFCHHNLKSIKAVNEFAYFFVNFFL